MDFFPLAPSSPEHSDESKHSSRGHWRAAEDAKLMDLVMQHGPQNWNMIAENLDGRSGKSCRLRWFNQLDPRINQRAFSEEEEERMVSYEVKNHWYVIMARNDREESRF